MTKHEFEQAAEKLEELRNQFGEAEDVLAEMLASEHAPSVRWDLVAAKMSLHGTRMVMLNTSERLREVTGAVDTKRERAA